MSLHNENWSEWTEWNGEDCPLPAGAEHQVRLRDGTTSGRCGHPETWRWNHEDCHSDIIAYRYKIKYPESKINSDLEKCAKYEWKENFDRVKWNHILEGPEWFNGKYSTDEGGYKKSEHSAARKKLGLNQPGVTPEEEEAWQEKEGRLIGGPRKAESFLMQAADLMAERGKQYDQDGGERSMGKTVAAFNAITGRDLTESEGWLLMSILKRVRQHSGAGYHKDSAEDAVAYAALEAEALECAATQQS